MFAGRRSGLIAIGTAAVVLGGCGSGGDGSVPASKIIAALDMKKVQGRYAIDGNPFCSIAKILRDAQEVRAASSTHRVIASHDATIGIVIIKPFAPTCRDKAQRKLNRLTGKRKHRHHRKRHAHGAKRRHAHHRGHRSRGGHGAKQSRKGGGNGG
jgi:hypothetical protein